MKRNMKKVFIKNGETRYMVMREYNEKKEDDICSECLVVNPVLFQGKCLLKHSHKNGDCQFIRIRMCYPFMVNNKTHNDDCSKNEKSEDN